MTAPPPVLRAVHVRRSPDEAFQVFTDGIAKWWPLATYSVTDRPVRVAFTDGRIVETSADGETSEWGEITIWDPPHRLAYTWHPGRAATETPTLVEVVFRADDEGTRVELTHSGWEVYGEEAAAKRDSYDTPDAWAGVLALFAKEAAA